MSSAPNRRSDCDQSKPNSNSRGSAPNRHKQIHGGQSGRYDDCCLNGLLAHKVRLSRLFHAWDPAHLGQQGFGESHTASPDGCASSRWLLRAALSPSWMDSSVTVAPASSSGVIAGMGPRIARTCEGGPDSPLPAGRCERTGLGRRPSHDLKWLPLPKIEPRAGAAALKVSSSAENVEPMRIGASNSRADSRRAAIF